MNAQDQIEYWKGRYNQVCRLAIEACEDLMQSIRSEQDGAFYVTQEYYCIRKLRNYIAGGGAISVQEFADEELVGLQAPNQETLQRMIERRLSKMGGADGMSASAVYAHLKDMGMICTESIDGEWELIKVVHRETKQPELVP